MDLSAAETHYDQVTIIVPRPTIVACNCTRNYNACPDTSLSQLIMQVL